MLVATWLLVVATGGLVVVTAWYVFYTRVIAGKTADAAQSERQSAAAAERSAKAAEAVVELEREREREPGRPEIKLTLGSVDPLPGDTTRRAVRLPVQNTGPGDAYEVSLSRRVEFNSLPHDSIVETHPPKRIQSQAKPQEAVISYLDVRGSVRVICILHYTDTYSTGDEPRVYHSVFDDRDSTFRSRYYRHDQPLDSPYAEICDVCRGAK